MSKNINGSVVLIIGASSGIGRALAEVLAERGARLAISARRQSALDDIQKSLEKKGFECFVCAGDASNSEDAERVVTEVIAHYGGIDILVLNAGGAPAIDMRSMQADEVTAYMRSNYDVTANVLFPVLQHMKQRRAGRVVHTNSLAGFVAIPLQGPYCAAKAASRLLMDSCRAEFSSYGIGFTTVYPGFVATEATQADGMPAPLEISERAAAEHIAYAIVSGKQDYLFPFSLRWLIRLARILPKSWLNRLLASELPPEPAGKNTQD